MCRPRVSTDAAQKLRLRTPLTSLGGGRPEPTTTILDICEKASHVFQVDFVFLMDGAKEWPIQRGRAILDFIDSRS